MCNAGVLWENEFSDVTSAVAGRHAFLRALTQHGGWRPDADACALIYGELVGNAVTHGKMPVRICVECNGSEVRLFVRDAGGGFRRRPGRASPYSECGRGLEIVSSYTTDLRIDGSSSESLVSAALPEG